MLEVGEMENSSISYLWIQFIPVVITSDLAGRGMCCGSSHTQEYLASFMDLPD